MKRLRMLPVILLLATLPAWSSPASEECEIADRLAHQGLWDDAVMFYEKALALNPYYSPAINGRANALRHLEGGGTTRHHRKKQDARQTKTPTEHRIDAQAHTAQPVAVPIHEVNQQGEEIGQPAQAPADSRAQAAGTMAESRLKSAHEKLSPGVPAQAPGTVEKSQPTSSSTASASSAEEQPLTSSSIPSPSPSPGASTNAAQGEEQSTATKSAEHAPPSGLILAACVGFAALVALSIWWLSGSHKQNKAKKPEHQASDEF